MNRLFIKLSGLFFALILMQSCTTDFETTASYEDITIVYGLLDQKQADQYIKINKAFLSDKDILTYAAIPDSSYYPYVLEVTLQEINDNGNVVQTFTFDTTTIYNKEEGQFYFPNQVLYKWNRPDYPVDYEVINWGQTPVDTIPIWLNTDNTYKLVIKNPETEKFITAETFLVDNFRLLSPIPYTSTIRFIPEPVSPRPFKWKNDDNGGKYEIDMLFHYGELKVGSTDTVYTHINVMSNNVTAQPDDDEITIYYWDDRFFSACDVLIPYEDAAEEDEIKDRFSSFIEIIISAAEQNFSLYLEVNEPSTSIIQDKPQYSNIDNGLGIFSSRSHNKTLKKLNSQTVSDLKSLYPHLKFKY